MGNCRPKIIECLNDVNDFLEDRCGHCCECERRRPRPRHNCCCEEENLFTPCRPIRRPCSDCCCDCDCDRCCDCDDCCRDCENVFMPCSDRRGHSMSHCCKSCSSPCCGNSFEQMLRCMIGKKVRIAIGSKCGTVCILDLQGRCVRAMVVGSGKIVIINTDQITQIREIC